MSGSISVRSVLWRTAKVYADQALVLLPASVCATVLIGILDISSIRVLPVAGLVALIAELAVIALFTGVVVRLVADVIEVGRARSTEQLMRAVMPVFGQLMLVGFVAGVVIGALLSALSFIALVLAIGVILSVHVSVGSVIAGVVVGTVLFLVPGVFLITIWSVVAPIVVLERPGGLRALRRSRILVRGNRWRVVGMIVVLTILLGFADRVVEFAGQAVGSGSTAVAWLLVATLFAPLPIVLATTLYYELRETSGGAAPAIAIPPVPPDSISN